MTMMNQTARFNEHLDLEIQKHPERLYETKLLASQPQFSAVNLRSEVQAEAEYWKEVLTTMDVASLLETFKGIEHVFDALKHESDALGDLGKALVAHGKKEWADASILYQRTLSDLHFALSDWSFAAHEVADDSPFDPYSSTKEEREKHDIGEPPRSSYADMRAISAHLFRLYQNVDRVLCVGQEITQRQITCLSKYMQAAEEQEATRLREDAAEKQ